MADNITKSRHPDYKAFQSLWDTLGRAYNGGSEYVAKALQTHRLEHATDYQRRLKQATLLNYLRPICDAYANYLFRPEGWGIKTAPSNTSLLEEDADRRGTDFFDFWKSIAAKIANLGFGIVGVDAPKPPAGAEPRNRAEQEALKIRPYLYWISPVDLLDWQVDEDGNITAAMVREQIPREMFADDEAGYRYRVWHGDRWELYDDDGARLEDGPNAAGVVPLVPVRFRNDGEFIGIGLGQDLEPLQREILNLTSCLQEILYRQTFSQLVLQGVARDYSESENMAEVGTSAALLYPEGMNPPQFISANAAQAATLIEERHNVRDEIYRLAQLTTPNTRLAQVESGVAIALKFVNTNEALADFANQLLDAMRKTLVIAARWGGDKSATAANITIEKPNDFGVITVGEEVTTLATLYQSNADAALIKEQEKRVGHILFPKNEKLQKDLEASQAAARQNPFPEGEF